MACAVGGLVSVSGLIGARRLAGQLRAKCPVA